MYWKIHLFILRFKNAEFQGCRCFNFDHRTNKFKSVFFLNNNEPGNFTLFRTKQTKIRKTYRWSSMIHDDDFPSLLYLCWSCRGCREKGKFSTTTKLYTIPPPPSLDRLTLWFNATEPCGFLPQIRVAWALKQRFKIYIKNNFENQFCVEYAKFEIIGWIIMLFTVSGTINFIIVFIQHITNCKQVILRFLIKFKIRFSFQS